MVEEKLQTHDCDLESALLDEVLGIANSSMSAHFRVCMVTEKVVSEYEAAHL